MKKPIEVTHISSKEERDPLLEYNTINVQELIKIPLCGVGFDDVTLDEAVAKIKFLIDSKKKSSHVMLLDPVKLMYFRENGKLHHITENADMILAEGCGIKWASDFVGKPIKGRIPTIGLMMDLIRLAEIKNYTIFLYGGKENIVESIYHNLSRHFPKIRIVGRHAGFLNANRELMVKESMRKTSPDIIFIAKDFLDQEKWIDENRDYFGKSVIIGVNGSFDILSGKVKKAPDFFKTRGLTWFWRMLTHPWKINRYFRLIQFFVLALLNKIKNKKQSRK